jgi:hypothetical protein
MAIHKTITDNVGNSTDYHRIGEANFDFDKNQVTMIIKSYVNESYRDSEKEELNEIDQQITLYNELSAKENLTDEERVQLAQLNIQELSAKKHEETFAKANIVTFDITQEIRDWLYALLAQHPDFTGSIEV